MKKRNPIRLLSFLLVIVMTTSIIPMDIFSVKVSAKSCYGNLYDGAYGKNTGEHVANIAYANFNRKLGQYYGEHWCADFACDCWRKAGVSTNVVPDNPSSHGLVEFFLKKGQAYFRQKGNTSRSFQKGDYQPQKGDIVGICTDNCKNKIREPSLKRYCVDHIGLVLDVSGDKITTIEGNVSGVGRGASFFNSSKVKKYDYRWTNGSDNGYGYTWEGDEYWIQYVCHPAYSGGVTSPAPSTTPSNTPVSQPTTVKYSTGTYKVTGCTVSGVLNIRNTPGGAYAGVQAHQGDELRITEISGVWGKMSKGWVSLQYCTRIGNLEPEIKKPAAPSLSLSTSADHATGSRITVTWPAASDATCYDVYLKNSSGTVCQQAKGITTRSADFMVNEKDAGTYTITAYSRNSKYTSNVSNTITVRAHAPSTVTFVDYNSNTLSKQKVKYGANAVVPPTPSRYGFTFSGWSGSYTNVKSNQTVTAQYTRNKYTVKFFNEDGTLLNSQKVYYESGATAPSYTPSSGYNFVNWDKDFSYITGDTSVTAVVKWYDEDMSVNVTDLNAVRDSDGTGITVTYKVTNQKNTITSARAIIALKTSEGKLVTTTESAAFSIKNNVTKSQEVFVPTTDGAYSAEVYIVANYKTAVPVSANKRVVIDQGTTNWTSWSTTEPPQTAMGYQFRTEYRYKDKKFTTGSSSSMNEWTLYNTTWAWGPYGSWSGWTDTPISETESRKVEKKPVETSRTYKTIYHYYRYRNSSGSTGNHTSNSTCNIWEEVTLSSPLTESSWGGGYKWWYNGTNYKTMWPCSDNGSRVVDKINYKTQYRYCDRSKVYTYHFWQWGDWSDWGTTAYSETDNRAVETRKTYRYRTNEIVGTENNSGIVRTISGKISPDYSGKDALLIVYKVDEASDYSNQYVEQLKIGTDGSYSSTFKLLSEPTVASGDYTVTLGIAGTNEAIYIDTIEAPKPEYTVTFHDQDGTVLDTQTLTKGGNATFPETPEKEGYHFVYWDSTATNVTDDLDVYAHYEINTYTVVFVNWTEESVTVQTYEHGQPIAPPEMNDTDSSKALSWEGMVEGEVTQNMIITAKYETKTFNVRFIDWNNNLISAQTVEYGQTAEIPEALKEEDYVFFNWTSDKSYTYVTEDAVVVPTYWFEETVSTPIVDIKNGDYDSAQTVTITCPTEDAIIYYTIDGSDPNLEGALEYEEPITIDRTCELRVIASAFHMNNSYEETRYIAINTDQMTSDWTTYDNVPEYVLDNLDEYEMITEMGYRYKDVSAASNTEISEELKSTGWIAENEVFGEWSGWMIDKDPRTSGVLDSLIDPEVEEKDPDPEDVIKYQYSRWKYVKDGEINYSRTDIGGFSGEWEYLTLDNRLSIASYDGAPAFSYNGEIWYNQTYVTVQEVPNYKLYRYRSKTITYSRWTEWTIDAPSANETREYESDDVFRYTAPNKYVVSIVPQNEGLSYGRTGVFFNNANQKLEIDIKNYEIEGYTFDGFFKDSECNNQWNLENDTVDASMSLYLKWTPKTYTVTFVGFDDEIIETQDVEYLEYADAPVFEDINGYVFCGFDTDSLLVTGDMVVTANYVKEEDYVKLSLNKTNYALYTGSSFELEATVTPETAENKDVIWTSSDENIAYVDDMGKITAVAAGTVTIYATCYATGYTQMCTVTVSKNVNESLILAPNATCGTDDAGQLRGIKPNSNTVAEVKKQFANTGLVFTNKDGNALGDDDLVGTGTVITLMSGYTKMDEITVVITGDMNGDGKINNRDVAMGTRYLVDKEAFEPCQITAFDVNGDGKTNNRDASMISRYLVGKETI